VGSFEQAMPQMAAWLSDLPGVEPAREREAISPRETRWGGPHRGLL